MFNVGNWLDFDYVDRFGVRSHRWGEIKEVRADGFLFMTENGYRLFKASRISNVKLV